MPTETTMTPKKKWMMPLAFVLGLLIGTAIGWAGANHRFERRLAESEEALKSRVAERFEETGIIRPDEREEETTNEISGVIVEVGDDSMVIESSLVRRDPFADPLPKRRTVVVSAETAFVRLVEKDPEEFQQEFSAWAEAVESAAPSGEPPPEPPAPVREERTSLSSLRVGTGVTVVAGENVLETERFTAVRVIVTARAEAEVPTETGDAL